MKIGKILAAAGLTVAMACGSAMATPSTQIWIPSTDVKDFKTVNFDLDSYTRFSPKGSTAGPNYWDIGVVGGVLPLENLKLEVGVDYLTTNFQNDNALDNHPFYFNTKLGTPEDAFGIKGLPAFAVGIYNLGTYDKPEVGVSTRQNIAYGLVARTLPVIGRLSVGGYVGSKRALASPGNPSNTNNNSGVMASWDRTMSEISDKLWFATDYMSGNNFNGEVSVGASWAFSKQISLIVGAVFFNPFYKLSNGDAGATPGGKPALTTQIDISLP
jgi:hypothetical protein